MGNSVRLRIAPSPTGNLHVGNARTALFNYLYARQTGGVFILRIDDTDAKRSTEADIEGVLSSFRWLGLDWDEGFAAGGEFGPYRQSERLPLYQGFTEKLLENGKAYRCWCTPEELDSLRKQAQRERRPFRYPQTCLHLSAAERAARERSGDSSVVRFHSPHEGTVEFVDLVRGEMKVAAEELDDLVIVRADGMPTYNFASVIDDSLMHISHVIRGADHLYNTHRQIPIARALGFDLPAYAHLPLLTNPDRTKLGKRSGAVLVGDYAKLGYLPEAVLNFLALLGWNPGDTQEVFSLSELAAAFSLERVNKANAVFELQKLIWLNGVYIRSLAIQDLTERSVPFLADAGLIEPDNVDMDYLREAVGLEQERLKNLAEAPSILDFFFAENVAPDPKSLIAKKQTPTASLGALKRVLEGLELLEKWDHEPIESCLRGLATELGWKAGQLFMPIRVAITGKTATPPLFETMVVLGRQRTLKRIDSAIGTLAATIGECA
ncbi:MAG: glutamate--tRNA ligase [Chloroflexi bacterium]|nr:glutamate--tRNA ligase [Chloroflexota bacterium]